MIMFKMLNIGVLCYATLLWQNIAHISPNDILHFKILSTPEYKFLRMNVLSVIVTFST